MEQGTSNHSGRLTRREAIRRGAIVGGNLLWIAPAIQTLATKASAHVASPGFGCCECRKNNGDLVACFESASTPTPSAANCTIDSGGLCSGVPSAQVAVYHEAGEPLTCSSFGCSAH